MTLACDRRYTDSVSSGEALFFRDGGRSPFIIFDALRKRGRNAADTFSHSAARTHPLFSVQMRSPE